MVFCPKWACCPWAKNLSNLVPLGSRLWAHSSETSGDLSRSKFYINVMICSCAICPTWAKNFSNLVPVGFSAAYQNCRTDFLHLKFFVIVLTCCCILRNLGSPAYLTHMGLPMDQNTYLWNCWTDYLCPKFYKLFRLVVVQHHVICPFDTKGLAHSTHRMWISETVRWILFQVLWNCLDLQLYNILPIWPIWAWPWARAHICETVLFSAKPLSKPVLGYCQLDP